MARSSRDNPLQESDAPPAWTRRRFLQGVGTCIALPALPSLLPPRGFAAESATGGTAATAPVRMAFVTFPNGCNLDHWWPTGEGATFQLNQTMAP